MDSESTDDTSHIIDRKRKDFPALRYAKIKKKYFDYGTTRNLGVKLAQGKYICFISGDALPLTNGVFNYLLEDFSFYPRVIAVYGKQIPNPNHNLFYQLELLCKFELLDNSIKKKGGVLLQNSSLNLIYEKQDKKNILYFLSNVFACYKKSFLLKYPFKKGGGEDLLMGRLIIEEGFTKVYDPRCIVRHSHNYNLQEYYKRQKEELLILCHLRVKISSNLICKVIRLFKMNMNCYQKFIHIIQFILFYLIKLIAFIEVKLSKRMFKIN